MSLTKKLLKAGKAVGKAVTAPNNIQNGGGLSSFLVPREFNTAGIALIAGGATVFNFGKEGLKSRNAAKMGRVSYGDGLTRMTSSFTSKAPQAMMRASGGNYAAFSDMAEEVVAGRNVVEKIDTYGANPALISALYNMGGR
jgi:hypothetical protein